MRDSNVSNNVEECSSADARNHSPQQYGRWPYVFIIKDENIPSSTLNRLNQGLVLNERGRSYLLGALFDECINAHSNYDN